MDLLGVVPARAGMSPRQRVENGLNAGGPRASGDEPLPPALNPHALGWSPRERG